MSRSRRSSVLLAYVAGGAATVLLALTAPAASAESLTITSHSDSTEFSPNADGQEDVVEIGFCLSAGATVTTTITAESSTAVTRTLERGRSHASGCTPAQALSWAGNDDGGVAVADGRYLVRVHAVGSSGDTADAVWPLDLLRQKPGAITSPHTNELLAGTADVVFTPSAGFPHAIASFQAGAGAQLAPAAYCRGSLATGTGDGDLHSTFDTAACPGAARLSGLARYVDAFGHPHNYVTGFLVEIDSPVRIARITRSQEFSPNGDGVEDSLRVAYCLTRASTVTTTITPEGSPSVVRALESDAARSADCYATGDYDSAAFTWKGRDDLGVDLPDGRYVVHVSAQPVRGDATPVTIDRTFAIERRLPGRLSSPDAGATIAGGTDVAFTPTAGFPHDVTSFVAFATNCRSSNAATPGPDGALHAVLDAAGCSPGPTIVRGSATYVDDFGETHLYPAAGVPIDVPPVVLSLEPNLTRLFTGTQLRVTAILRQGTAALDGRRIRFTVISGPNAPRTRTLTTGATGRGEFIYYGTNPWIGGANDTVAACWDVDADDACDAGEQSLATTIRWIAARRFSVSAGTAVVPDATHLVRVVNDSLYCDTVSFKSKLSFEYARQDGSDAHTFSLTRLDSRACWDEPSFTPGGIVSFDSMQGSGVGTLDGVAGYHVEFQLTDHGEPGAAAGDTMHVTLTDGAGDSVLSFESPLGAGNLNAYQGELLGY